jgi:hypothetical protein
MLGVAVIDLCQGALWEVAPREVRRADIHDGPEQCSNERPDTLMQDHHLPGRRKISCNARSDHTMGHEQSN